MRLAHRLAALLPAAALAACGSAKKAEEDAPKPVALITTAVARSGALQQTVIIYGVAEFAAGAEHTLASPLEATVQAVLAAPGATVRAGQPIVTLSPSPTARLELQKTGQDAATADKALARALRLRAAGLVGDAEVESARGAARAAADASRSLTGRTAGLTVRAPVNGVVEGVTAAPGDLVAAGAALGKVGALGASRIRLGLDPAQLSAIRIGQAVRLSELQGRSLGEGRVVGLDPRIDPQTRLAGVLVQGSAGLAPGRPLRGELALGSSAGGGVVVPRVAVVYEGDAPGVFVVEGGVAHRRPVRLSPAAGDVVAALDGLKPGETVAVEGAAALEDGMAVRTGPVKAEPAAAPEPKKAG